jgi:hypothetical protein
MAADDLGAPQEALEDETGRRGSVRSIHGLDGRRRRRRGKIEETTTVVDLTAGEQVPDEAAEHEPLFTREPLDPPAAATPAPAVPSPPRVPSASPAHEPPATLPELDAPPIVIGEARERRSRIRGIWAWWRQESLARAAEKRALANAEAVLRAQAIQSASAPAEKAPTTEERAGSMRSLLSLNEERFQSLGLRSDRLRDELVGISTSIADLRGLIATGTGQVGTDVAAADLLGELQARFDSLLPTLSEEIGRRSEESERRISLLLSAHAEELATHLELAVEDIVSGLPTALPEEMQRMRELIPEEMQRMRELIPEEMERLHKPDEGTIERALGTLPAELDKVRSASEARLEIIETNATAKLEWLRVEQHEQLERLEGLTGNELSHIREEIAGISESIRGALADMVPRAEAQHIVLPEASAPTTAHDSEMLDRRFMELLVAMNANTDRLADALHRGLYALELQVARRQV